VAIPDVILGLNPAFTAATTLDNMMMALLAEPVVLSIARRLNIPSLPFLFTGVMASGSAAQQPSGAATSTSPLISSPKPWSARGPVGCWRWSFAC
jgi:hypothetical protein